MFAAETDIEILQQQYISCDQMVHFIGNEVLTNKSILVIGPTTPSNRRNLQYKPCDYSVLPAPCIVEQLWKYACMLWTKLRISLCFDAVKYHFVHRNITWRDFDLTMLIFVTKHLSVRFTRKICFFSNHGLVGCLLFKHYDGCLLFNCLIMIVLIRIMY